MKLKKIALLVTWYKKQIRRLKATKTFVFTADRRRRKHLFEKYANRIGIPL